MLWLKFFSSSPVILRPVATSYSSSSSAASAPDQPHSLPAAAFAQPLPGEIILTGFADPALPPAQDLTLLHRCLDTFLLAAKGMKEAPLSANGEIAAALRGEARVKTVFLPRSHPIFHADGQLADRWGTPFFFHAGRGGVPGIRSAGPDKILWTADDLHREPNGSFLRGPDLNPPSLFPER